LAVRRLIYNKLPKDWGWGTHTDEVRIHQLSGAHFSVFNSPYVQNFAKLLEIQLIQSHQGSLLA